VITGQNVSIKGHHPIDSPAYVQGRVKMLDADPRGHVLGFAIEAVNAAGEPFAEMLMTLLLLDPATLPERGERAARIVEPATPGGIENVGVFTFTPEAVRCFELNRPPSPHTDPDLARAAGFSKPIAAGNQVFSIIWNRLVAPKYTFPVQLAFTLKRPIFWDETVTFERRICVAAGREILEVRNAAGKTSIICEISGSGSLE
jgi:acyl dehydratase